MLRHPNMAGNKILEIIFILILFDFREGSRKSQKSKVDSYYQTLLPTINFQLLNPICQYVSWNFFVALGKLGHVIEEKKLFSQKLIGQLSDSI